jgi:hypothetical protein
LVIDKIHKNKIIKLTNTLCDVNIKRERVRLEGEKKKRWREGEREGEEKLRKT